MHRVILPGAGGPAGLNSIKSLKESKEPPFILGLDINPYHIEFARPLVDAVALVPRSAAPNYIDVLNKLIEQHKIDFIYPQSDPEVRAVSENREKIHTKNYLPPKETVRICQDKHESAKIWKAKGFPSVKSILLRPEHLEEDIKTAFAELGNNLWIRATEGAGGIGSTPSDKPEIVLNWIRYWYGRGKNWKFIAQEFLPGDNIAFQSLWKKGKLITSQARERIEYIYPYLAPSGVTGTPVVARTIHNELVNQMATKAVQAVDPDATGIFCVDIKFNKEGQPMPTEINVGRFFTTSYFFSHAGTVYKREYANMPALMLKLAFDEPLPAKIPQYNALPADLYWIRHIDCGQYLIPKEKLEKNPYEK